MNDDDSKREILEAQTKFEEGFKATGEKLEKLKLNMFELEKGIEEYKKMMAAIHPCYFLEDEQENEESNIIVHRVG